MADAQLARAVSRSTVGLVTMKEVIPLVPCSGSVTAVATKISPTPAWVMKILLPFSTIQPPSARAAVVCVPPGVGAGAGLGEAEAAEHLPARRGAARSAPSAPRVPKATIGEVPSVVCAETVMACEASTFASSSMMMM